MARVIGGGFVAQVVDCERRSAVVPTVARRCRSRGLWWGDAVFEPAGVVVLVGRRRRRDGCCFCLENRRRRLTMESNSAERSCPGD